MLIPSGIKIKFLANRSLCGTLGSKGLTYRLLCTSKSFFIYLFDSFESLNFVSFNLFAGLQLYNLLHIAHCLVCSTKMSFVYLFDCFVAPAGLRAPPKSANGACQDNIFARLHIVLGNVEDVLLPVAVPWDPDTGLPNYFLNIWKSWQKVRYNITCGNSINLSKLIFLSYYLGNIKTSDKLIYSDFEIKRWNCVLVTWLYIVIMTVSIHIIKCLI